MNSKVWIVAKREYLTRVQKKSFIIVTLLTPLGIAVFAIVMGLIMNAGSKSDQRIIIKDETGIIQQIAAEDKSFPYEFSDSDVHKLKEDYQSMGYDLLIYVPALRDSSTMSISASYYSKEKPSLSMLEAIESHLADKIETFRMRKSNIDRHLLDSFKARVNLENGAMDPNHPGVLLRQVNSISLSELH
jgi:ABC-2 type transport system permease protein